MVSEQVKAQLLAKNEKLIDMVIERAKRDFPDDIAIIGLTGSFTTGDYHEKSDLDLIIINNTPEGWGIAAGFILDDVGYDLYCTPWDTRIHDESTLESPMVSSLVDLVILYCASPEDMERFESYRQRALSELAKPIGRPCLERAKAWIDRAKQCYADAMLGEGVGAVRHAAGGVLYHAVNAIVNMNNTYIKRGIRRYLEELSAYPHLPNDFERLYRAVIEAHDVDALRVAARALLGAVIALRDEMWNQFVEKTVPTYENLWGTYEEMWSNYRNKVLMCADGSDVAYAFQVALSAQEGFDETARMCGTPRVDLMQHFDAKDLTKFRDAFLQGLDIYLNEYSNVGREVARYAAFDALYARYMAKEEGGDG